jgi:hypothetical protein
LTYTISAATSPSPVYALKDGTGEPGALDPVIPDGGSSNRSGCGGPAEPSSTHAATVSGWGRYTVYVLVQVARPHDRIRAIV